MLTVYLLGTAIMLIAIAYLYSIIIEKRGRGLSTSRKGELSKNMWAAMSLDCDFEPTKHAFGPGRSVNQDSRKPLK